jgi:hypothetical protein
MFKKRKEVEELVYKVMDILDPTQQNSQFYKAKFAKMNDKQFIKFFSQDFPLKFQIRLFEIESTMKQISDALDYIHIPMIEQMNLPFEYRSKDGTPVKSDDALILYVPIRKVKQFLSKKNSMSTNISNRDMKSGLLQTVDKNGNTSDREMESLAVMGLDASMKELATYRADSMNAKDEFYSMINTTGMVRQSDVDVETSDSLARNELNVYLLGAALNSNLINEGNYLRHTLTSRGRKTERES